MEQQHRYIAVSYDLYTDNAHGLREVVEQAPKEHPFQFITNFGMALEAFEAQVGHLNAGDTFAFTLSVDEAYGPYEEAHVLEFPKENFHIDGRFDDKEVYPGAVLPLVNEDGMRFDGLVSDVKESTVVLDLNHPLAGKTLHYTGTVVTAREATNEEIQGVVNMLAGGGCGCGCDHDHGHECGCGDDCHCGEEGHDDCGCHGEHHHHSHQEEGTCACGGK